MKTQRLFVFLLSLSLIAAACVHIKEVPCLGDDVTYTISGTVLEVQQYCGGAVPSDDSILHPRPRPKAGVKLYIRRSSGNQTSRPIIDSVVSGSNGSFSIQLPAGEYCFVEPWHRDKLVVPTDNQFQKYDTACYRKHYGTCDFSLYVQENSDKNQIVIERSCAWNMPCVQYSGPLPPSAPPTNRSGNQPGHQE